MAPISVLIVDDEPEYVDVLCERLSIRGVEAKGATSGEDALAKLSALVRAFLQMGCTATLQLNILDRETLLCAQKNPDAPEFRTLIVRVWGFSAVFVELPRELQDHVLARTQHGM